jgi:hypothetical protein
MKNKLKKTAKVEAGHSQAAKRVRKSRKVSDTRQPPRTMYSRKLQRRVV